MLEYDHNYVLVVASFAIAVVAGFTGLSLTQGASALTYSKRKLVVAMSAVALGGGIWSMHFVAMLGLQLPVLFFYDALPTLISVLIAILLTGIALILVHFGRRTKRRILLAGAIVGVGIAVMHYIGMAGMELCRPVYSIEGIILAGIASVGLSMAAFWIAYGRRETKNLLLGTLAFSLTVFAVHFIAMYGTGFIQVENRVTGPWISNITLAFIVTIIAFLLLGGFLSTGINFALREPEGNRSVRGPFDLDLVTESNALLRIPYEKEGRTNFIDLADVAAIRAEGHYTVLYSANDKLFCPWSISEAESRLAVAEVMRTHRSYLVNLNHVTGFEKKKDTGACYFSEFESLTKVPVARTRISEIRQRLGL